MVGYVKLDKVDEELASVEVIITAKAKESIPTLTAPLKLADKNLCYMVQRVDKSVGIKSVVACFGTSNMSKETMYRTTWNVIGDLELAGIQVITFVSDGAGVNRGFMQMNESLDPTESGTVYVTKNLFAPERPLFLLNDLPHILKTLRNCLYNSGRKSRSAKSQGPTRSMKKNGQELVWDTIRRIYGSQKGNTIKTAFKLNQEDVYLTSYSIMSVSRAAHVLSRSTATVIRKNGWKECEECTIFCETCNDIFDMMNGRHAYHGIRTRNHYFDNYEEIDDPRFQELDEKWKYFEDWAKEVSRLPLSASEKERKIISAQTLQGVERTIKGFTGAVKLILELGRDCKLRPSISAAVFSQDDLEHYFGKLRARFRGNRNPNLQEGLQAHATLHVASRLAFRGRKRGNTGVRKSCPSVEELSAPLKKRPRMRSKLVSS